MSAVGIKDTIARGLAAAGTAGGLGTSSLTSKVGLGDEAVRLGGVGGRRCYASDTGARTLGKGFWVTASYREGVRD